MGFVTSSGMELQSPRSIAEDILALLLPRLDWFNPTVTRFLSKCLQHIDKVGLSYNGSFLLA